jgi:hypothetical protein
MKGLRGGEMGKESKGEIELFEIKEEKGRNKRIWIW